MHPTTVIESAAELPSHSFSYPARDGSMGRVEVSVVRGKGSLLSDVIADGYAEAQDQGEEGEEGGGVGGGDGSDTSQLEDEEEGGELPPLPEIPRVDRFGFVLESDGSGTSVSGRKAASPLGKAAVKKEDERTKKWLEMLRDWVRWEEKGKVKSRLRKGVPECIRGAAWVMASGGHSWLLTTGMHNPMERYLEKATAAWADKITLDLHRTFPDNILFMTDEGSGQASLLRVLLAYSAYDPGVGYCQGMAFVVALFLMYMSEAQAFATLVSISQTRPGFAFAGLWEPGFPLINVFFHHLTRLLEDHAPDLAQHLEAESVHPSLYATGWFMTLFSNSDLPFVYSLRIMDQVLYEGQKALLRWALAFMLHYKDALLQSDLAGIYGTLKCPPDLPENPDLFVNKTVLKISLPTSRLLELDALYASDSNDTT